MAEAKVKADIRLALGGRPDVRLFNNPVGLLYTEAGAPVKAGLGTGTSDLVGWRSVVITPEMVGQRIAQFVAIETKAPAGGHRRQEQKNFVKIVNDMGGRAGFARSIEEAQAIVDRA